MGTQDHRTPGNQTKQGNIPALERATGIPWAEWVATFEARGAAYLTHTEIARIARDAMPGHVQNPDWWAQGAAIAFEQHAGLRVPGQSSSGTFRVSVSRTVPLDRDAAVEAWVEGPGELTEHLGFRASGPRRSRTEKRTFLRFDLEGAGKVEVAATPNAKDPAKSSIGVSHDGLPDGDSVEAWRAHWKALLVLL